MKNFLTKKNVLFLGLVGTLLVCSQFLFGSETCGANQLCNKVGDILNQDNLIIISMMPFVFFFSLITYKMRDEVFEHWMKFAVWFVPAMIVLSYLILGGASSGGLGIESVYGGAFDAFLFMILYGIFIGVSLYRIVSKYKQLKRAQAS